MRFVLTLLVVVAAIGVEPGAASEEAWNTLRAGNAVALLRHARAPGTGDPQEFRLEDCTTQRNLSNAGRNQARKLGEEFRTRGVQVDRVLSSRWCRSLETARLAFGDLTESYPPLDSFFSSREQQSAQTEAVRHLIAGWSSNGVLVLVTHQVNITALTGIFPSEGEMLVLRAQPGADFEIAGRIKP